MNKKQLLTKALCVLAVIFLVFAAFILGSFNQANKICNEANSIGAGDKISICHEFKKLAEEYSAF